MPIICLPNCAYLSEVSRVIAIYRKLEELGADVIMASHGGTFEFQLDQEGIPYEKVGSALHYPSRKYVAAEDFVSGTAEQGFYHGQEAFTPDLQSSHDRGCGVFRG